MEDVIIKDDDDKQEHKQEHKEEQKEKSREEKYIMELDDLLLGQKNYIKNLENKLEKCDFELMLIKEMSFNEYRDILNKIKNEKKGIEEKLKDLYRLVKFYKRLKSFVMKKYNLSS